MSQEISGFGLVITLIASKTFKAGLLLTQFPDDTDPFDTSSIQICETGMGLNGDMYTWSKATPIPCVISVGAGTTDDQNLQILAKNNRVGKNKSNSFDEITATAVYPDSTTRTYTKGRLTDAPFGKSVASAGRLKTNTYSFIFENEIGA